MRNGDLDTEVLTELVPQGDYLLVNPGSQYIGAGGKQYITRAAMPYLYTIAKKFRAQTGKALYVREAWRSRFTQMYYIQHPPVQGGAVAQLDANGETTSIHGWGGAIDVWSGIDTSFNSPEHVAFEAIAKPYGWINTGRNFNEPWHFELIGNFTAPAETGTTTPVEDDVALSDDDIAKIAAATAQRLVASQAWQVMASQTTTAAVNTNTLVDPSNGVGKLTWAFALANGYSASQTLRTIGNKTSGLPLNG